MARRSKTIDPFVQSVAEFIDRRRLIAPAARIVVGVSGGADSVALLAVLAELSRRPNRRYKLTVAHLNHGLRRQANADQKFVADMASRWTLPFAAGRCNVARMAREQCTGTEEAGRAARYDFLRETAGQAKASCVAVAHHADDNVETILYRIVRGTALRGLCGIPPSRPMTRAPAEPTNGQSPQPILLVRPLLEMRREQIEQYLGRLGLPWREDHTNKDVQFRRNFIRHRLLPLLRKELNPRADEAILHLAAAAIPAQEHLYRQAGRVLADATLNQSPEGIELDCRPLAAAGKAVASVAIRVALERLGAPLQSVGTDRLDELLAILESAAPARATLPGRFIARRELNVLSLRRPCDNNPPTDALAHEPPVRLNQSGKTVLGHGLAVICRVGPFSARIFALHCRKRPGGVEFIDADKLEGPLFARPRQHGDIFKPLGCPGRQTVSDFLTNLKLTDQARDAVRCICDDAGIVYLAPLRIDQRVRVTPTTKRVVHIAVRQEVIPD